MTRPETKLCLVEKRSGEANRKYEYRGRDDGGVTVTEHEWDYAQGRWRYVGSRRIDDLHMEMAPDGQPPRTGP